MAAMKNEFLPRRWRFVVLLGLDARRSENLKRFLLVFVVRKNNHRFDGLVLLDKTSSAFKQHTCAA
jgi:hypothetical protein